MTSVSQGDEGLVWIRTSVEYPGGYEEDFLSVPRSWWDAMSEEQQRQVTTDAALDHQNNVAPCGGDVVPADQVPEEWKSGSASS
jgi:hypothetical protein